MGPPKQQLPTEALCASRRGLRLCFCCCGAVGLISIEATIAIRVRGIIKDKPPRIYSIVLAGIKGTLDRPIVPPTKSTLA